VDVGDGLGTRSHKPWFRITAVQNLISRFRVADEKLLDLCAQPFGAEFAILRMLGFAIAGLSRIPVDSFRSTRTSEAFKPHNGERRPASSRTSSVPGHYETPVQSDVGSEHCVNGGPNFPILRRTHSNTALDANTRTLVVSVVMTVRQRSSVFPFCQPFDIPSRLAGGRGSFLIVLVVVVVLALAVRKAIDDDNEHEHDWR
jgi:hypothetical protein